MNKTSKSKIIKTLPLIGLLGIVATSTLLRFIGGSESQIKNVSNGISTCFSRAGQSYTAKLISDTQSVYLDRGFMKMTEECFGEGLAASEKLGRKLKSGLLQELNSLSEGVHWFHERLVTKASDDSVSNAPQSIIVSHLGTRFEKLELKKDKVIGIFDEELSHLSSRISWANGFFLFFAIACPFLFGWQFFRERKEEKESQRLDSVGAALLGQVGLQSEVEEVLIDVLKTTNISSASALFESYRIRARANNAFLNDEQESFQDEVAGPIEVVASGDKEKGKQISRLWDGADLVVPEKRKSIETVNAEDSISNILDFFSGRLFSENVDVSLDSERAIVEGDAETVEQICYQIISSSLDAFEVEKESKSISIKMRKLGGILVVDFIDTARPFDLEFLNREAGIVSSDSDESLELFIGKELARDIGAQLSFSNISNGEGELKGRKVQVTFKSVSESTLVDVQKGTKRELQQRLQKNL